MVGGNSCRFPANSPGGKIIDYVNQRVVRADNVVTGLSFEATLPEFLDVFIETGEVFSPDDGRFGYERPGAFQVNEASGAVEGKFEFLTVEKMKEHEITGHITLRKGERSKVATLAAKVL